MSLVGINGWFKCFPPTSMEVNCEIFLLRCFFMYPSAILAAPVYVPISQILLSILGAKTIITSSASGCNIDILSIYMDCDMLLCRKSAINFPNSI